MVGGACELVCWLDKPSPGALFLTHVFAEIIDDNLEVMEEESCIARLVLHHNLAVLVARQDVG